jgi:hypothetical protein
MVIDNRPLTQADIKRGQEIWAEIQANRANTEKGLNE